MLLSQANEVEDAIAADNQRAVPVSITGASGSWAAHINGLFEPTQATGPDGRVVYAKCGDASVCIEHFAREWEVKHVSTKRTFVSEKCYTVVAGGCGLEACTSRVWRVWDGKAFHDAPGVKLVAEAEVRLCLLARAPPRSSRPPTLPF